MSLATFIGGRYSSTYNAGDQGITRTGYELAYDAKGDMINQSDAYGQTLIDFLFLGVDVSNVYDSLEAGKATTTTWPWGTLGAMGIISRLGTGLGQAHVLSSTLGTPAAATPASLTGTYAILAPGFNANLLYNSTLRTVPVRLQYLPGSGTHFTTT